ncbi:MAG: PAS domain-containing protein [Acetobacteraceae bacterium]|nr:PAS domain-containing protein [Acetobacteraceae bacterium]
MPLFAIAPRYRAPEHHILVTQLLAKDSSAGPGAGAGDQPLIVVGIGASAGGVEALQALFRAMPEPPAAMAFVVVTHLGAGHESALPAILGDCTDMPIHAARDGDAVAPGHAYVLPHDAVITIADGRLVLRPQAEGQPRERQPIDVFLASLALDQRERAVGIVLSGTGSDGTLGLKAIKEQAGLTIAQGSNAAGPRYPEMPASAVAGGAVDLVLMVEDMPARLAELTAGPGAAARTPAAVFADSAREAARAAICAILRVRVGHDFAGYKAPTFFRRVQRRAQVLRLPHLHAYVAHLQSSPEEAGLLFRDLLIGVTGFFRDADAFAALAERVIPALFDGRGPGETVRVWVPGCATGEEAYTLAILLRERMDAVPGGPRAQIFATDIDETALGVARRGRYPAAMLSHVGAGRLAHFFVADGESYAVSKVLRELCVFSAHSVIRDPPFSRMDLVSCRNLLIYFGGTLQDAALPLFHYALRPGGVLFLGVAETIARHADLFTAVDKAHHIYRRREHGPAGEVPMPAQYDSRDGMRAPAVSPAPRVAHARSGAELRQATDACILDQFAPAHVVVNRDGDVVHQSPHLGRYLEPSAGTPSRQLLLMARRGLRLDLRVAMREAMETRRRVVRPRVDVEFDDRRQAISLTVTPLPGREGAEPLFVVVFSDLGPPVAMPEAMATGGQPQADDAFAQLERDLRDLRERLQTANEEYETATEQLKSANEEMVSVNEELQSTNEELETSKEELQSVNEELRTANLELTTKIDELDRANSDLRNLFDTTQIATLFLDRNLLIRSFTPAMTAVVNLVPADRGRAVTAFASTLDAVDLPREMRKVLDRHAPVEQRVAARGGTAHYLMRLLPYRTTEGEVDGVVATFIDVTRVVEGEVLGTLVDELNHRVRNMLAIVQAVAASTIRRVTSLDQFATVFAGRIRALAQAHELIAQHGWSDVELRALIDRELAPYAGRAGRLVLDGPPLRITPKAALALGMVLHEMATNAMKYGALSAEGGRVAVSWNMEGTGTAAQLVLRWIEEGGPPPSATTDRRGFGSELIERQLRHDLHGSITIDLAASGLRAVLTLPAGTVGSIAPRGGGGEEPDAVRPC